MAFALPYAGLFIFSAVRLVQKRLSDRLFLLAFLGFCILTASGAYVLSGSGYNFKEALEGFLWLGAGALILKALLHLTVSFACWQERVLGGNPGGSGCGARCPCRAGPAGSAAPNGRIPAYLRRRYHLP